MMTRNILTSSRTYVTRSLRRAQCRRMHRKYREFTMASAGDFYRNLLVVDEHRHVAGCVVECGVWRGGSSAAMAELLGSHREYFLFDSFEGLPKASDADGDRARKWQEDTSSATYYDNCRAPIEFAERAMELSGATTYRLLKGWFEETIPSFVPARPIAILRLDGDWYESTMTALQGLFKYLAPNGVVIVDDYYAWDGCSRAIHDFLSRQQSSTRITQQHGVCVLEQR